MMDDKFYAIAIVILCLIVGAATIHKIQQNKQWCKMHDYSFDYHGNGGIVCFDNQRRVILPE